MKRRNLANDQGTVETLQLSFKARPLSNPNATETWWRDSETKTALVARATTI